MTTASTENAKKPFIVPVFIPHAGCPHRCIFCNQQLITRQTRNDVSPVNIRRQVLSFLPYNRHGRPVEIAFYGGNFLGLPPDQIQVLLADAAEFIAAGTVHGIRFSTRPDTIDEKRLAIIRPYPVSTVELGVQSMDDRVLALSSRGHTAADTVTAVGLLKKFSCQIGLQLMIGLPGDSDATTMDSARQVAALKPDFVRIYPTVVLTDSPLAVKYRRNEYEPLSLETAVTLTKHLYLLFRQNQIAVIRMGLQASDELADNAVVLAGPYHPAFGHMVYAEIFLDKATELLKNKPSKTECVTFCVNPRSVSRLQGIDGHNFKTLKQNFALTDIRIVQDEWLSPEDLVLS